VTGSSTWPFRLARVIPSVVLDEPWALFVKTLCILSGVTTFIGPTPGTIESSLPQPVVYLWSATLVLGAGCGLVGLLRPQWRGLEITGLIWLGTAAAVYSVTIFVRFGFAGAVAGSVVLAFALAALVRALAVYVTYELAVQRARQ
jgi:hypothetical protein